MKLSSLFDWRKSDRHDFTTIDERQLAAELTADSTHGNQEDRRGGDQGMLSTGRFAQLLHRDQPADVEPVLKARAWKQLQQVMAFVPGGLVPAADRFETTRHGQSAWNDPMSDRADGEQRVRPFYMDRHAVTNADYLQFVENGGYDSADNWPAEIWPSVVQFVDQSGHPGPRFWENGRPSRQRMKHPVVGISWYEAAAYARWCGKRLPTSTEWERAGSWPSGVDGRDGSLRYPWGNAFVPKHANTSSGSRGDTVPVHEHPSGSTPNGIYQLVGNVWEWVADRYNGPAYRPGVQVYLPHPMAEIRGAAFDTYFESQSTCQFRTGQPYLYRGPNVGVRCVIGVDQLAAAPEPSAIFASNHTP